MWPFKLYHLLTKYSINVQQQRQENFVFEVGIITSKALQDFSAKLLVMEAAKYSDGSLDFAAELWNCCCAFSLRFWAPDFIFTPTSYVYVAHIRISLPKLQSVLHNQHYKDHLVKRWDTHQNFWLIALVPNCHVESSQYSEKVEKW